MINKIFHSGTCLVNISLLILVSVVSHSAYAVPEASEFNLIQGNASYDEGNAQVNIAEDRSVFEFTGNGFDVPENEVLSFIGTNDGFLALGLDQTGSSSQILGGLAGNVNLILINSDGVIFGENSSVSLPSLIATTYQADQAIFRNNGELSLTSTSSGGIIEVRGLSSTSAHIMFIADDIDIEGDVSVSQGQFSALAGGKVLVSYENNMLQYDITESLSTSRNQKVIDIASNATVTAEQVNLEAWVTDARSLAINNDGIVEATGVGVGSNGVIRLLGAGGTVRSEGRLVANGEDIDAVGVTVELAGDIEGGDMNVVVGDTGDDTVAGRGRFTLAPDTLVKLNKLDVTGSLRSSLNEIFGLANYRVTGLNQGTAAYRGVAIDAWQNIGAVTFKNVGRLSASSKVDNTFVVESNGQLQQQRNGIVVGTITGGTLNDRFLIAGTLEFANGSGGNDVFEMIGGSVRQELAGGDGIDSLENVFNPQFDTSGFSGSGDFVASWIDIENVLEFEEPIPVPVIPEGVIAPQVNFIDVAELANVSLGLIGGNAEPRLPCGYTTQFATPEEKLAKAEEDCYEPDMALISSIIHFDNDSAAITAASAARLAKVSNFVTESELFEKVVISAHTDDNASIAYNNTLSKKRAHSTAEYMQSQGVKAGMIEKHHFGESLPAVSNTSEENRAYNRRAHIDLKK